jgi:hypothetical protein
MIYLHKRGWGEFSSIRGKMTTAAGEDTSGCCESKAQLHAMFVYLR